MRVIARRALSVTLGSILAAAFAPGIGVAEAKSTGATASAAWVLVADESAEKLYVTSVKTGKVTGQLNGIEVGTHAGVLQLGDGEVALMDESKPRLDIVRITAAGKPRVVARYRIPQRVKGAEWERAGWLAADSDHRYVAVGSDFDGSTTQQVTVIDLEQEKARTVTLPVAEVTTSKGVGTEEMETFLVGKPLRLVVSAGGRLDAYRLGAIMRGVKKPKAFATTKLAAYPHGPIVNSAGTVIGSTLAEGIQTVRITKGGFGKTRTASYPWPSVQSYRPVMAPDGTTAVGAQAGATAAGTSWDQVPVYLTSSSTARAGIASVDLGKGAFSRTVATKRYAATVVTDSAGDNLTLVRRKGASGGYTGAITKVTLPGSGEVASTKAPAARLIAATPAGDRVFVGRTGESALTQVSVVGGKATVTRTIDLPAGASADYLTVVVSEQEPYDLSAR